MIISYSHDFVFIRNPKVGSSSVSKALHKSGLVDPLTDISSGVEWEHHKHCGIDREGIFSVNLPNIKPYLENIDTEGLPWIGYWLWNRPIDPNGKVNPMFFTHLSYHQLKYLGLIDYDMPSYCTIRNPIDRFLSFHDYVFGKTTITGIPFDEIEQDGVAKNYELLSLRDPEIKRLVDLPINEFWQMFKDIDLNKTINGYNPRSTPLRFIEVFRFPQTYWGSHNTTWWPLENINSFLRSFFRNKGVKIVQLERMKDYNRQDRIGRSELTQQTQQEILDYWKDDFLMWEKVMSYRH